METPPRLGITRRDGRPVLRLRLRPGAGRGGILGFSAGRIRVAVSAPPVEGAANRELLRLLARALRVAPSRLAILSGDRARDKDVLVDAELSDVEIRSRLGLEPPRGELHDRNRE